MLRDKLGIGRNLCDLYFSEQPRWARIDMSKALSAECYEAMDLVETRSPMDAVGTND